MFELFKKGLMFGAGFIISVIVIGYVALNIFSEPSTLGNTSYSQTAVSSVANDDSFEVADIEGKINLASHIFITKYEETDEGFVKAVITDILKNSQESPLPYSVGDVYPDASFYKESNDIKSDGSVIFFVGGLQSQKMYFSYFNKKIGALGFITVDYLVTEISE